MIRIKCRSASTPCFKPCATLFHKGYIIKRGVRCDIYEASRVSVHLNAAIALYNDILRSQKIVKLGGLKVGGYHRANMGRARSSAFFIESTSKTI